MNPSAVWLTSRMPRSRRKSGWRTASRTLPIFRGHGPSVPAGLRKPAAALPIPGVDVRRLLSFALSSRRPSSRPALAVPSVPRCGVGAAGRCRRRARRPPAAERGPRRGHGLPVHPGERGRSAVGERSSSTTSGRRITARPTRPGWCSSTRARSAPTSPPTSYTFEAAGVYPFVCTPPSRGMGGRVVRAGPRGAGRGVRRTRARTITWSPPAPPPTGSSTTCRSAAPGDGWAVVARGVERAARRRSSPTPARARTASVPGSASSARGRVSLVRASSIRVRLARHRPRSVR